MKDELLLGFEYDHWANRRWIEVLGKLPFKTEAEKILRHIASAQNHWIGVCFADEELVADAPDVALFLQATNSRWRDLLSHCDPTAFASYEREGKVIYQTVAQIASHVINHGTYHRGHLRGLCDAHSFEDFMETDFVRFLRETER